MPAAKSYSEFEDALFLAIVDASDANPRGQCEVFETAERAGLGRKENWINDAVNGFEGRQHVDNVSRPLGQPLRTLLMVTAEGRKHAEHIRSPKPSAVKTGAQPFVPKVFVSSTFIDMQACRRKVHDALTQLEAIVRGMEQLGSKPGAPVDECLKVVRSCQLYVGVFGMRYGSVPEGYDKSMTHLEYDEAQRSELPSLIYILDENHPIPAKDVETGKGADKLRTLKEQLKKRHTVSFFTTPESLEARILHDVRAELDKMGAEVSDTQTATPDAPAKTPQASDAELIKQRRAIYDVAREAAGAMVANSKSFDGRREVEFMQAMEDAYFIFGDDVLDYLNQLWGDICDVRATDTELEIVQGAERVLVIKTRREALTRISQFHRFGKPLFARYMRFAQPL